MLIQLARLRPVAFFALLFCVPWSDLAFGGALEAPIAQKKTVLVLYGERLSIPPMRMTEQGLMAGLSSGHARDVEVFSEYLDLTRFPAALYGDDLVRYLRARYGTRKPDVLISRPELERGIIGGALLDFSEIGGKTATLALRVLAGERLPLVSSPDPSTNPLLINWRALRKWRLSESRIPREATVLYREPSLWEQRPRLILATAATLVLQSLLIAGLIVQRSKMKQTEGSLRESEERMSLAAESANLGIWVWDIPRDDIWATEKCRSLYGFQAAERVDFQRFIDRVHPDDREQTREAVLRLLQTRGEFDAEHRLQLPDSGVRWISARGHAIFDNHNRAARLLGVSIDITARKLAKFQVQQLRDELAHLSRVTTLGEMATTLAHELNQPVGAIHSYAEAAELFLQKNPPDLNLLRYILGHIRQDAWRTGEVIHRMRSLLRRQPFKMDRIEVKGLLEALGGLLQSAAISRKARLRFDVAPALPPLWGDAVQLQQVLLNLIVNALDAMVDCPEAEREVLVRALPSATWGVEMSVTDRGPGFSNEILAKLFEPFFTTKKHGMGIGLRICQTIIEAHGGQLTAENNPDRGATMRFTLPASPHEEEQSG